MAASTLYYKDFTINIVSKKYDEVDFNSYDKVIEIEKIDPDDPHFCKLIEISVNGNITEKNALIIASYNTPIDSFVAPHKNGLFLMLNEILCVFDPETLEIIDQSEIDPLTAVFCHVLFLFIRVSSVDYCFDQPFCCSFADRCRCLD